MRISSQHIFKFKIEYDKLSRNLPPGVEIMSAQLTIYTLIQLIQSDKYSHLIGSIFEGRYHSSSSLSLLNNKSFDVTLSNFSFSDHYTTKSINYQYPYKKPSILDIVTQFHEDLPSIDDNISERRTSLSSINSTSSSSPSCIFQSYQILPIFLRQFLEKYFPFICSSSPPLSSSSSLPSLPIPSQLSQLLSHIHVIAIDPLPKSIVDYTFLNDLYSSPSPQNHSIFSSFDSFSSPVPFLQVIVTNFPLSSSIKRKKRYISFTILMNTSHSMKLLQEFVQEFKEILQNGTQSQNENQRDSI